MSASGCELHVLSDHAGEEFVPVITNGDGACSLHSVFGIPTINRRTGATEMYCSDARSVPAKLFGASLQSVRERVSQKDLLQAVETSLFADLWTPEVTSESSNEIRIFNGLLQQSNVSLHDRACAARTADLCGNERADAAKATLRIKSWVFFCSEEAAHYVCVLAERSRLDWTHWHGPCVDSDGYVKGTRERAPSRIPQSKYDARAVR